MKYPTATVIGLCGLTLVAIGDSYMPRSPAAKIKEAELIVYGVANSHGLPLTNTTNPVKCSCTIQVLEALWPTNAVATNSIVVDSWAWSGWPESWWRYNSRTGVYFLMRTSTAVKIARERNKYGYLGVYITADSMVRNVWGTNVWCKLDRFNDWYEPATNTTYIRQLMFLKTQKNGVGGTVNLKTP